MTYFWKQQDDIPAGMGYPLFGTAHILSLIVILLAVELFIMCYSRTGDQKKKVILKVIPVFMCILELFKDAFLVSVHRFSLGYLPLHACSIGIFVFLLREFLPWNRIKAILGEIALILIMPGSVAALIFPNWTELYPVWNFMNLYSFLWHGLLVLYPLLIYCNGEVRPSVRHIYYEILFLCVVVPPIYAFDKHFGYNYFFVNWPEYDTPLEWIASFMGNPGYLLGYALLTIAVMLTVYLLLYLLERIRGRIGKSIS